MGAILIPVAIFRYGLEKDTGMTDMQYDQGLAVFYATYIVRFAGPSAPAFQEHLILRCLRWTALMKRMRNTARSQVT